MINKNDRLVSVIKIFKKILDEDINLLSNKKKLIENIEVKIQNDILWREKIQIIKAIENDIGKIFLSAYVKNSLTALNIAQQKAVDILKKSNMQDKYINDVIKIFTEVISNDKNNFLSKNVNIIQDRKDIDTDMYDRFFTDYMAVMEPGFALKGTIHIQGEEFLANDDLSVILPIRKELLEYFTPKEIAEYLRIEDIGNAYAIYFAFPLGSMHSRNHHFDYVKIYAKEELIYLQTNVPTIEIWPNIQRENYNKYYLYYENADSDNKNELGINFFYVLPYGKNFSCDVSKNGLANQYTTKMHGLPETLLCKVNTAIQDGMSMQTIDVGLLLLSKPKMFSEQKGKKWTIIIDVRSHETAVFYSENHHSKQPLNLSSHLFQITDSGVLRNNTYLRFIPSTINLYNVLPNNYHLLNQEKNNTHIKALIDGHIWMLDKYTSDTFNKNFYSIDWQKSSCIELIAYLEQICMQVIVEAIINEVDEINWKFIYSIPDFIRDYNSFKEICKTAVIRAEQDTGFSIKDIYVELNNNDTN